MYSLRQKIRSRDLTSLAAMGYTMYLCQYRCHRMFTQQSKIHSIYWEEQRAKLPYKAAMYTLRL